MRKINNLRQFRFFKSMTQDELAVIIGYDQSLISKLERGLLSKTPRTEKMQKKISDVFGFSVKAIFPEG